MVNGTLAELQALLPPATLKYVEKQPRLEDVFLFITGNRSNTGNEFNAGSEDRE